MGRPDFARFLLKMLYFPEFFTKIGAPQKRPFLPPPIPYPAFRPLRLKVSVSLEKFRGPKTPPQNPEMPKKCRVYTNCFRKVRANFCLLPCDTSQAPKRKLLRKTCSDELFYFGCFFFFRVGFPPLNFSREGFCRNPRGIFPSKVLGEFCGGFFGGFFRAFSLEKDRRKKSTQKSTAKFKSEFGSLAAKIHTARIWP